MATAFDDMKPSVAGARGERLRRRERYDLVVLTMHEQQWSIDLRPRAAVVDFAAQ